MRNLRGRAKLRGIPLDDDCKKAKISLHEYGPDDNRKFCYGAVSYTHLALSGYDGLAVCCWAAGVYWKKEI